MIRALLVALLIGLPSLARAQAATPCPTTTIGWALQWPGPITAALYDQQSQLLYIIWNYTIAQAFSNVPTSVMQSLSNQSNPVNIYNYTIIPGYHQLLLTQKDNCPLQIENAKLCPLLNETGKPLLSQTGTPLLNETVTCPISPNPIYLWTN